MGSYSFQPDISRYTTVIPFWHPPPYDTTSLCTQLLELSSYNEYWFYIAFSLIFAGMCMVTCYDTSMICMYLIVSLPVYNKNNISDNSGSEPFKSLIVLIPSLILRIWLLVHGQTWVNQHATAVFIWDVESYENNTKFFDRHWLVGCYYHQKRCRCMGCAAV